MTPLQKYAIPVLIIFHTVGLIGMAFVNTEAFAELTFYNLALSLLLMLLCHDGHTSAGLSIFFGLVFLLGYSVEVLGVHTGFPFGEYEYGPSLGPKVFEVPISIGFNWFLMVMGSGFLAMRIVKNDVLRVVLASAIMVGVDFLIETIAPKLDYWYWENDFAPATNYIAWFVVSLLMQILFLGFAKRHTNKLAIPYIVTVVVFFGLLNILL